MSPDENAHPKINFDPSKIAKELRNQVQNLKLIDVEGRAIALSFEVAGILDGIISGRIDVGVQRLGEDLIEMFASVSQSQHDAGDTKKLGEMIRSAAESGLSIANMPLHKPSRFIRKESTVGSGVSKK